MIREIRETPVGPVLRASLALALSLLAAPGCIVPTISSKSDAGSSDPSPSSSADGGAAAPAAPKGASCTAVTPTISLCQAISTCPSLTLNPQVLPQCGFRIHGAAIDPECYCQNQYLCPIGSPTTCSEAAQQTTGDVTYDSVCSQAVTGRCTDLNAGAGSTTSAACQACVGKCDNVPSCISACGC